MLPTNRVVEDPGTWPSGDAVLLESSESEWEELAEWDRLLPLLVALYPPLLKLLTLTALSLTLPFNGEDKPALFVPLGAGYS